MQQANSRTRTGFACAVAAAMLSACAQAEDRSAPEASNSSGEPAAIRSTCLAAAEISLASGLEVREFPQGSRSSGDSHVCAYQATDNTLGAFITTVVGPAAQGDEVFSKMAASVRLLAGASAQPEAIQLGERGLAYGSISKSEAAAVSGGRLFHAEVVSTASANIGDRKAGMIEIVKRLMGA